MVKEDKQIYLQYYMSELGSSKEVNFLIMHNGQKGQWFSGV